MPELTVFVRPGCHLCDDALAVIGRVGATHDFSLQLVDIERDPVLHARYLERIPVIALDGEELYDFFVDEDDLRRRLDALESSRA
ncbi:MAG TPA: glutaredoxin family protein [Solirubrobacteraceae bacterium]